VGFRAAGRLDRASAGPFVTLMTSEAAMADRIVVVDVTGVELVDVAGLRALDQLQDLCDETRAVVLLRGISGARDEVLRTDRRLRGLRRRTGARTD
jgi:anti-anti-sigma regulatory factor